MDERDDEAVPMTDIAVAGGAFAWLYEEPELYSDTDPIRQNERGLSAAES
jgi:hypothetical protein